MIVKKKKKTTQSALNMNIFLTAFLFIGAFQITDVQGLFGFGWMRPDYISSASYGECVPAMDHGCVDGVILVITQRVAVGGEPKTAEGGLGIYKRDKGKGVVFVRDKNWNYCRQSHPGNVSGIKPEERLKMLSWDWATHTERDLGILLQMSSYKWTLSFHMGV